MFCLRDISNIMAYIYNNTVILVVYHGGGRLCKYYDVHLRFLKKFLFGYGR